MCVEEGHESWLVIGVDCTLCGNGMVDECIREGHNQMPSLERMQGGCVRLTELDGQRVGTRYRLCKATSINQRVREACADQTGANSTNHQRTFDIVDMLQSPGNAYVAIVGEARKECLGELHYTGRKICDDRSLWSFGHFGRGKGIEVITQHEGRTMEHACRGVV